MDLVGAAVGADDEGDEAGAVEVEIFAASEVGGGRELGVGGVLDDGGGDVSADGVDVAGLLLPEIEGGGRVNAEAARQQVWKRMATAQTDA